AVLLLPVQISLLGVAGAVATPTSLLYNVIATPGAIARYRRHRRLPWPLVASLTVGSVPGTVVGVVIRAAYLSGEVASLVIVAAVLGPLGAYLLAAPRREPTRRGATER